MRTTVNLDPDVAAAVEGVREAEELGMSEAINALIRRALVSRPLRPPFVPKTYNLGLRIDVDNVAEALELLDGPEVR
jgi:hypothetical protein